MTPILITLVVVLTLFFVLRKGQKKDNLSDYIDEKLNLRRFNKNQHWP